MGPRRRGAPGGARQGTQGAAVSSEIRARLRTRRRGVQRGPAAQRLIVKRPLRDVAVFAAVTALLWVIWAIVTDDRASGIPWPVWPTLGMGIAAAVDAWRTFGERGGR